MKLIHPLAAALAALVGCQNLPSVGPDYVEPTILPVDAALPDAGQPSDRFAKSGEYLTVGTNADSRVVISSDEIAQWWRAFNDPILENLVGCAVSNNASFKMAVARLEESEWELLGTYAAFLPHADISGSWISNIQRHNNASMYTSTEDGARHRSRTSNLSGGMDWEIDIFGGNRRRTESALAMAEAAGWTVADAWVSLTTTIGRQYVSLRTVQDLLAVARTNLVLQTETYDILKSRLDSGIGDELAVNQCAYVVEQTRAKIPTLRATEEKLMNSIAILAGTMPGTLNETLAEIPGRRWLADPHRLDQLPMDLLRGRPDVQIAECKLAAQTAQIGVAKAQWFPRLFITGSVGYQAMHATDLFEHDSLMSSFGPSVSWPIFQGGAIYANVKYQEAKTREAVYNYESTVESALADVRNAYSAYTEEQHKYKSLQAAVKAATDAVTISQDLYKNGLRDFNNVLDAQRSRLSLEEALANSRGQITENLIDLYRALGGGLAPLK